LYRRSDALSTFRASIGERVQVCIGILLRRNT
jgi:hypothetical protein